MAVKKKVLIGTYWTGQFDRWRGYYNYPIAEGDEISEQWQYVGANCTARANMEAENLRFANG